MRAIIPAAGKGTRLHADEHEMPKVMHRICGTPILRIVLENTAFIKPEDTYIVVGYKKEQVMEFAGEKYNYVEQKKQLGTGDAVAVCAESFKDYKGSVLVAFGDMPMFRYESMREMCLCHEKNGADCTLMTARNDDIDDWAKIFRGENGDFVSIIEGRDCVGEQKNIKELFAGVLVFNSESLFKVLPMMTTENAQKEYYLTEVPSIMAKLGMKIETFATDDPDDLYGVNTEADIAICEKIMKKRGWEGRF